MINQAYKIIEDTKNEIMKHSKLLKIGINIDNYVHNHRYKNDLLLTNIKLYESYLKSYHIYHMSFLSKLKEKFILIFRQIERKEGSVCPDVRIEVNEEIKADTRAFTITYAYSFKSEVKEKQLDNQFSKE
jgi:hypothetical protein